MNDLFYLDASAWLKRYFVEPGSQYVRRLLSHEAMVAATDLGYIEVAASLARRVASETKLALLREELQLEGEGLLHVKLSRPGLSARIGRRVEAKTEGSRRHPPFFRTKPARQHL